MVLGMEGKTNTSSQEEFLKIWYFQNPKEPAVLRIKEIWQAELGKLKKSGPLAMLIR